MTDQWACKENQDLKVYLARKAPKATTDLPAYQVNEVNLDLQVSRVNPELKVPRVVLVHQGHPDLWDQQENLAKVGCPVVLAPRVLQVYRVVLA